MHFLISRKLSGKLAINSVARKYNADYENNYIRKISCKIPFLEK